VDGPPLRTEPALRDAGLPLFETGGSSSSGLLSVSEGLAASLKGDGLVWDMSVDMYIEQMGDKYGTHDQTSPVMVVQSVYFSSLLTQRKRGDKADFGHAFTAGVQRPFRETVWDAPCVIFVISFNLHYSIVLMQNKIPSDGPRFLHLDSLRGQGFHSTEEILGLLREGLLASCPASLKDGYAAMQM
jgi:hypothetical protein